MGNFSAFFKSIDYFFIIDILVFLFAFTVMVIFFVLKRNIKIPLFLIALFTIELALHIGAGFRDSDKHKTLLIAKYVMHYFNIFVLIGFCVTYQSDLKDLTQRIFANKKHKGKSKFSTDELFDATENILTACQNMAKQDIGAIIIIENEGDELNKSIIESGVYLDAKISSGLLESIFNTKAPLHDGAVVVKGDRVVAAGCFLSLTEKENLSKELGTRHRAAIGVTEQTDVLAIVVSEETGIISVVRNGNIRRYITMEVLKGEIEKSYGIVQADTTVENLRNYIQ